MNFGQNDLPYDIQKGKSMSTAMREDEDEEDEDEEDEIETTEIYQSILSNQSINSPPILPKKTKEKAVDPFTDEDARSYISFGSTDMDILSFYNVLDRVSANDFLKRNDKEGSEKGQVNRCKSISLLCLQQYYFYWTLMLVFAGDFVKYSFQSLTIIHSFTYH